MDLRLVLVCDATDLTSPQSSAPPAAPTPSLPLLSSSCPPPRCLLLFLLFLLPLILFHIFLLFLLHLLIHLLIHLFLSPLSSPLPYPPPYTSPLSFSSSFSSSFCFTSSSASISQTATDYITRFDRDGRLIICLGRRPSTTSDGRHSSATASRQHHR